MELLAIPLGCQNTAAKWLVMRRCAVLAILMYLRTLRLLRSVRLASIPTRESLR